MKLLKWIIRIVNTHSKYEWNLSLYFTINGKASHGIFNLVHFVWRNKNVVKASPTIFCDFQHIFIPECWLKIPGMPTLEQYFSFYDFTSNFQFLRKKKARKRQKVALNFSLRTIFHFARCTRKKLNEENFHLLSKVLQTGNS